MKYNTLVWLGLLAGLLGLQGCANDPAKVYPAAPATTEYPATLSWATLNTPLGVDRYSQLVPAVSEKMVFVAQRNGVLSSLELSSGVVSWQQKKPYYFSAGPSLNENTLYLGTSKAEVIAFDAQNGEQRWSQLISSELLVPPIVHGERIIVRSNDGKVYGLRAKDGKIIWVYDRSIPTLTLRGNSLPVIVDDNVIVGFANGRLVSLSLNDGKTNWEATIALPRGRTELERMVDIDAPLVAQDGLIYVAAYNGKVAVITASTGSILWARDISSFLGAEVGQKNVYLTDAKGKVWALDKENGATLWMQDKLAGRVSTRPLVVQDKILVGDVRGELYWLSSTDGRLLGHFPYDRAAKASGASWVIDELNGPWYETQRKEATAVFFEPRLVSNQFIITYQNGVLAAIKATQ